MIEVEGPDGVVIEFPEGTSPDVIKGVMAKRYASQPKPEAAGQSWLGGMLDSVTQGAALGFGDELTGLESAVLGRTPEGGFFDYSKPFGERYDAAVTAERAQNDQFRADNPVSAVGGEVVGGLGTGLGMGRAGLTLMRGAQTVPGAIGRGAAEGAAYGAAYGAGDADEGDRVAGALTGGAVGGATGGAISGVTGQISKILAGRRAAGMAPSTQSLKGQASAAYERARTANPAFDGFDQWVMQAYQTLPDQGYHPNLHPQLKVVLDRVEELSRNGTAPSFRGLEQLRRLMQTPAGGFTNPDQQRLGKMLRDSLDTFMDQTAQRAASNPGNLPAVPGQGVSNAQAQAMQDVQQGRTLYSRAKKGEMIDRLVEMAEDRAGSTASGSNVENAIRQNARRILDNPRLSGRFSKEEIAAIRELVRGTDGKGVSVQNVLRKIGNMSPTRGGLMGLLTTGVTGAGMATMGPVAAVPAVATIIADQLARAGTRSQAQAVSSMVRGGPNAAATLTAPRLSPAAQAVVRALSAQAGGAVTPYSAAPPPRATRPGRTFRPPT